MKPTDTKTLILDTAQDLIQRFGINGMSYQDISQIVGIRKASIHTHFPTKEALVAALLDRYNTYFLRLVDHIIASTDSPEQKLRRYCGLFEATLKSGEQDKACLCGMLGAELATLNSPLVERICTFYQENEAQVATILGKGREMGIFHFKGDVAATAALVFSLLEGGILIARASGGPQRFETVIEQLMQLVRG